MKLRLLPLWGALLLALAGPLFAFDEETVQNFKKYFKTYKEPAARVEAVLALENLPEVAIVDLVVPILKDADPDVVRAAIRVLTTMKDPAQIAALKAVLEKEKTEAIRVGILRALSESKADGAAAAAVQLLGDKSWEVRRRALQLLMNAKAADSAEKVAPLGLDTEPAVRAQALDTLASFKSDLVVPKAIANLNDAVWQVRASAFAALKAVRHKDAVEPLVLRMQQEEGRLVPDLAETLANLTGQEHGSDPLKWKTWLTLSGKLGVEWATISGLFAGGESLFKTLRGKEDRWNVYLGSGLASAVMRAKEGPIGSIQGFFAGFAFVYAIDQFLPEENMPSVPGVARGVGAAKMPPVARRSAAAAAVKRYKRY
jgi:hypothetical protein